MNPILFLTIFLSLGVIYFVVGIWASRKVKTDDDYFIANRQLGVWQISSNLIATQLGGGMLLGTAASAYVIGYYGILYTLGMALGFLMLSCGIASRLQQLNVTTTAQLFETKYQSPTLKRIASILSIITLFGILIAQVIGFRSLMTAIGFGSGFIILPFWLSIICYTMIGGLRAITINDMIQLGVIIITFFGVFFYRIFSDPSSLITTYASQGLFTPEPISFTVLSSIILMPSLFSLIEQDLAQRFFASKSPRVATISAINATIFLLIFSLIPVYFGMQAKIMNIEIVGNANPLIALLKNTLPDIVFACVLCAIIAAIISTADALMNGISANITQDFKLSRLVNGNRLIVSKISTLIVGLSSLVASYFVPQNIIQVIIGSYELSISCLLVPLLYCYFKQKVKKNAAFFSIAFGLIGFILFRIYPPALIPREVITLALSLCGYLIGEKYTK